MIVPFVLFYVGVPFVFAVCAYYTPKYFARKHVGSKKKYQLTMILVFILTWFILILGGAFIVVSMELFDGDLDHVLSVVLSKPSFPLAYGFFMTVIFSVVWVIAFYYSTCRNSPYGETP